MGGVSLYPYYQRMGEIIDAENSEQSSKERIYRLINTILGSIIICVQIGIAIVIIKGVINKSK